MPAEPPEPDPQAGRPRGAGGPGRTSRDRGVSPAGGRGRPADRRFRNEGSGRPASSGRSGAADGADRRSGSFSRKDGEKQGRREGSATGRGRGAPARPRTQVAGGPRGDRPRVPAPPLPEEITGQELARSVQAELSSFPPDTAMRLARHLVAAGELLGEDPDAAYAHASYVKSRAPRLASVREAAGLAAYAAGHYEEAMSDLRAARRMTGSPELLPVIADVERALGRPERALEIASGAEIARLDAEARIEMRIVAAGARRDLGQLDAAVLTLQVPEVRRSPRLAYAYADALLAVGRREEARAAFQVAVDLDPSGETDADERLAQLDGLVFVDLETDADAETAVSQRSAQPEPTEEGADPAAPETVAAPSVDPPAPLFLPPAAG